MKLYLYKRTFYKCISFLLLVFFQPENVFATHSMGADISYECLGGNTYRLRISFYRDCFGIQAPFACMVQISSASCGLDDVAYLVPVPGTGQEITTLCPSDSSTCQGGVFTGIQEWVYEGDYTFPAQCNDWQIVYEQCCRNGAITTIDNPLNEEILIFALLNNTVSPCNNSPTFSNKPVPFVCQGQEFCFNHGAYDPDGDSLTYSLITPLSYLSTSVTYFPPYSPTQPLNSVPPMSFNYQNGDFCFTPQSPEVTVMAVLINEYRNGVFVGSVERDIQITVTPCNNNLPELTGINGSNVYSATICADAPFCFDVFSDDIDSGQSVSISWDNAIPTASLNINGSPHPSATFCWTPTQADVGGIPHCFTAKVTDDACPTFGTQIFSYCLTVVNVSVNAGSDQTVFCHGLTQISANGNTTIGSLSYQWDNGITAQSQTAGAGIYTVVATNGYCSASDVVQILPASGPLSEFNITAGCLDSPVHFSDASISVTGSINSWQWDFGDGSSSSQQNPSHQYSNPGTYNVCLIADATVSCPDTTCKIVTLDPLPHASFSIDDVCEGEPVIIDNNTAFAAGSSSYWNFGNGTTSTNWNPNTFLLNDGSYNVTLTVTDQNGCTDDSHHSIDVFASPDSDFNFSFTDPCNQGQVNFTDNTSAAITSWVWDLGNGNTSTSQNPGAFYVPGIYDVSLITTSTNGCSDTTSKSVIVEPPLSINVSPDQALCVGYTATLTANGGDFYSWSDGQTGNTISVTPASTTTYSVIASDSAGCSDTAYTSVQVHLHALISAGTDQTICYGNNATLTASGGSSYTWMHSGDTTNTVVVSPTTMTDYILTGTDMYGCTGTDTVRVDLFTQQPLIIASPSLCPGETAILDAGTGTNYSWSTGDTTQTINVSSGGVYNVTVTDLNGCTTSSSATVSILPEPIAHSESHSVCDGVAAMLDAGNAGCNYMWSTGETSQMINAFVDGNYSVTVTNMEGCSITFVSTLNVNPIPQPVVNIQPVCLNDQTIFNNSSTIASGTITSYFWDFGDGNTSGTASPLHSYSAPGNYPAALTLISDSGCTIHTITQAIVNPLPSAGFSQTPACLGEETVFTDLSVSNASITSWDWNFDDGNSSQIQNAIHRYSSFGNFNVQLIVTTINGCSDTASNYVVVHSLPEPNAGNDTSVCSGTMILVGTNQANGSAYTWQPAFNLTNPDIGITNLTCNNTFIDDITLTYFLIETDANGCTGSDSIKIEIKPIPDVVFSAPAPQCFTGNNFHLYANASSNNTILFWDFGSWASPMTSTASATSVSFSMPGIFPVQLTYSRSGCVGTPKSDTLIVMEEPRAGFIPPAEGCEPLTVSFGLQYLEPGNLYTWNIDGQSLVHLNPRWTFSAGTYPVTLRVKNENGCEAPPVTHVLKVFESPNASFITNPSVARIHESSIEFINGSVNATHYEWDFGDGTTDVFEDGFHLYNDTGTFDIRLIVTSANGCIDTAYGRVVIENGFSFFIPNAVTPNADGVNDSFQGYGTYIRSYQMWIYDRWGKMIYYTDDYDKPWNCNDELIVQNDTYVYKIIVSDPDEKKYTYYGSVTVVK